MDMDFLSFVIYICILRGVLYTKKNSKWFLKKNGFHHQICLFSILHKQKSHFLMKMTFFSLRI
jgi:hypothetical protein